MLTGHGVTALEGTRQEHRPKRRKDSLDDPDGAASLDSPTADPIESTLAGISIAGPIDEGLGVNLAAPLFAVTAGDAGITLGSNSRFAVSIGTSPGQCPPPPGAPSDARAYWTRGGVGPDMRNHCHPRSERSARVAGPG